MTINPSDEDGGKSGQQLGREHVEKVINYVTGLKERREPIPMRAGKPNWTAIALACGFGRGVFYDNGDAREVIEQALSDPEFDGVVESSDYGTHGEEKTQQEAGRAAATQRKLESRERRVQQLEEQLATKNAECEGLRKQVEELEDRLRLSSVFEEVMTTSGKRFIP